MVMQERRITIPAVLHELSAVFDFITETGRAAGLDDDAIYRCHLSIEEICTNIIEHGFGYDGERSVINIVSRDYLDRFSITVIDDAPPFDPLSLAEPDPTMPLAERKVGGWGVYFVKKYMDEVAYHNTNGQNHLTITKYK